MEDHQRKLERAEEVERYLKQRKTDGGGGGGGVCAICHDTLHATSARPVVTLACDHLYHCTLLA